MISKFVARLQWPGYTASFLLACGGVESAPVVRAANRIGCQHQNGWVPDGGKGAHTDVCVLCRAPLAIIWFGESEPSCDIIAHEAFHAVRCVLPRVGIPLTDATEEVYAYAIGSIVALIRQTIDVASGRRPGRRAS